MFSRKSLIELIKALNFRTHDEVERFGLEFNFEGAINLGVVDVLEKPHDGGCPEWLRDSGVPVLDERHTKPSMCRLRARLMVAVILNEMNQIPKMLTR